jgi:PAS domain S-box-containing protein
VINLLSKTILEHPYHPPKKDSVLDIFIQNNAVLDRNLKAIKPLIKELNKNSGNISLRKDLKEKFTEIEKFKTLYLIKENVLFPVLEDQWKNFRCMQVMWSFHDDIRRNIGAVIDHLSITDFDLKIFNRLCGDIFFNMYAIKFRDERILFPMIQETVSEEKLNELLPEAIETGFPYINPSIEKNIPNQDQTISGENVDLQTGFLSPEQIRMLFNHLPVDITFVDENNKVKYFSTPSKRIFPRTNAIIGRDVKNCHPPESVHVVEQIVEAFKKGERNEASFWIKMKEEYVLIQYFAVRDENGNYKGVIEVSQEISEIQNIRGEKRLLDWKQ